MREILFRGKSVDINEWVEGFYAELPFSISSAASPMDRAIRDLYTAPSIISVNKIPYSLYSGGRTPKGFVTRTYEVIPETVGECTGLTDNNGKRIFEGDIVTYIDEVCLVKWDDETAKFVLENENLVCDFEEVWCNRFKLKIEVIGNIHDNPELLEVKE